MPILHDEENRHRQKEEAFCGTSSSSTESDPVQYFLLGFIVKGTRQQDEIVSATTLMAAPPLSKPRQLGCCPKRQDLYPKKYAIYYGLPFRATAGFGIGPTWSDRSWLFYAPATTRSIIRIIFHVWTNQTISWQSFFTQASGCWVMAGTVYNRRHQSSLSTTKG